MTDLDSIVALHRANKHPLFSYLQEHRGDDTAWDIFATHYTRAIVATPVYLALLRERLAPADKEVLDFLVDTIPEILLLPDKFPSVTTTATARDDLPHLPEVDDFQRVHVQAMRSRPLPVCMGMLYTQLTTEGWKQSMGLLLKPYESRPDLIHQGAMVAMNLRAQMWDAIEAALTGHTF